MLSVFYGVLDMSAKASLVIGVVLLLRWCLGGAPKVYSYALWSVVLFRLLCPFSVESGVSILPDGTGYTPPETSAVLSQPAQKLEITDPDTQAVIVVPVAPAQPAVQPDEGTGWAVWTSAFACLWPAGAALMGAYSIASLSLLRRKLKTAVCLRDNIYRAEGIGTPFVLGVVRPKIYLPADLSEGEMPHIIAHEECHIRRGDHIVKILAFIALCLHWFNPLVWLAFHLAGKDMEMSCDEAVLKQMGGDIRTDYSQSLLTLATGRRSFVATPLAFGEGDPKGRIKNVLKWKKPSWKVTVAAVLVCAVAVVLCISDPARPVDTEQVTGVKYLMSREATDSISAPFEFEEAWVYEEIPVVGEEADSLLALVDGYTARRRTNLPEWEPRGDENGARLELVDGSYFELRRWYVNGFSFHPAHFGEDEYDTTLAKYDADGNLIACWTMEYDFDRPFGDWMYDFARKEKEQRAAADRRSISFIDLPAGQTCYLNEDIVLNGDGSAVTYQITYARAGLTLQVGLRGEDGTEYVHTIEGGSNTGTYKGFAEGRYTPFVRNVDKGYEFEPEATGTIHFDLTSEDDYFQNGTPWPADGKDTAVAEPVKEPAEMPDDVQFVGQRPGHIAVVEPIIFTPEQVLHHAILEHHRSPYSDQYFCCANYVVLANEGGTRAHPVTGDDLETRTYYLWVLYQEYLFTKDGIVNEGGAHIPTVVTLTREPDGSWSLLNYWEPRDGSYYAEDIRAIFPGEAAREALDSQKYIMAQVQDCYVQAVEFAKIDSDAEMDVDAVISGLLDVICSSPLESSNPKDYAAEHSVEYRELKYYGGYTRDYCERHLTALVDIKSYPANVDLRARVMEMLLGELTA